MKFQNFKGKSRAQTHDFTSSRRRSFAIARKFRLRLLHLLIAPRLAPRYLQGLPAYAGRGYFIRKREGACLRTARAAASGCLRAHKRDFATWRDEI